jgi:signal transduction histidine kinase
MLKSDEEIYITVIASALLMTFLTVVVVIAIVKYQNRARKHLQEVVDLKNSYHQEIMHAKLEMQEQTFLAISQEIHDNIGQILSLIRLNISTIKPQDILSTENKVKESKSLLDQAIGDLRELSRRLNSEFLAQQSLAELLQFQLALIQKTGHFQTGLVIQGEEKPLDSGKKLILFRISQEALNNVIKHAGAKTISIALSYLPDRLRLSIEDDGQGFDASTNQHRKGVGTQSMAYRAKLIGAHFTIFSKPGKGTVCQLTLPTTA